MSQRAKNQAGPPLVFEVEGTEHVPSGPERVLLRVDGRYGDRPGTRVIDAALYIDDGLAVHRHAPLPDPDGDTQSWLWRAAFDIPAHYLTDERTRFALESEPGRLVDLSPRGELVRTPSVPLSARAAHTARRYALAIAVLVTVAVSPGGLPATARTEVIRVQNPDGSVIYLTADGQQLSAPPADAVIVDQTAPAPAPEPAPTPEPEPQPEPAPEPPAEPAPDSADAVSTKPEPKELTEQRDERVESTTRPQPESTGAAPAATEQPAPAAEAPAVPTDERETTKPNDEPAAPPPLADPAKAEELQQIPALMVAASDDASELQPLTAVDPNPVPTQGLTNIDLLDAAGETTELQVAPPVVAPDAPPLIQLQPETEEPKVDGGAEQQRSGSDSRARDRDRETRRDSREYADGSHGSAPSDDPAPVRRPDGSPTPSNPGYVNALPGPSMPGAVPDFMIAKFRVPPFLLPIYQAAGIQYGIRWEVLAAINEIETDYGRNLNVSSAGALGWMQFMPPTWEAYGVDANKDGKKDPYNPVDAIFAAARYLKASGYENDVRGAIFAYNHADWYVDSVMLRAKLIAGYPADLVGSLTGLTEGRFPVSARARYADDVRERGTDATDRSIDIFAREGAPVVAVNDGIVKKIGYSKAKGRYVVLQDVYGNQYTYSNLGSVAKLYPVPKEDGKPGEFKALKPLGSGDPQPTAAASAGSQRRATRPAPRGGSRVTRPTKGRRVPVAAVKNRLFANPDRPNARRNGGFEQMLARGPGGFETYGNYFSRPLGLNSNNATLKPLEEGSRVVGSTVLGRVGAGQDGKAAHLRFEIRPAGRGAPKIDPKPILDGWKLLESTAIYRAKGKNVLYGESDFSIGQAMLMPERLLAQRVLSDPRIEIYPDGQEDIRTGQIDRRVLVLLTYLAESGLHPTVTSLKSGHSYLTASGNVSAHSSGNAVDIGSVNGEVITGGSQTQGSVTDQVVRRLMQLQGTMAPDQIISLLDYGANTLAMSDHHDHVHVGFTPRFGANQLNEREMSVLEPGQWDDLVERLGEIPNPTVPTEPSRYAIPDTGE